MILSYYLLFILKFITMYQYITKKIIHYYVHNFLKKMVIINQVN